MENWPVWKIFAVSAALVAIYFPVAGYLKYTYVPQPQRLTNKAAKFQPWPGSNPRTKAYMLKLPADDHLADSGENWSRSPMIIYENDKPLGPAHSGHDDIVKKGGGRYSHWEGIGLIFSTSDNTDPNTNGRDYSIRRQ